MASSTVTAFIRDAPPGEVNDVIKDIKNLTSANASSLDTALKEYHEKAFSVISVSGKNSIVSEFNRDGDGRYSDLGLGKSWEVEWESFKAVSIQSYDGDADNTDIAEQLLTAFSNHAAEHYPSSTVSAVPSSQGVRLLLAATKYSPHNFWNGRLTTSYLVDPSSRSLSGEILVDVHYYEDGNVRLQSSHPVKLPLASGDAGAIIKDIAKEEKKIQEELNRGFAALSEGAFKGLRRQLPVTRMKIEWDKIGGYRLGQDIGGGSSR